MKYHDIVIDIETTSAKTSANVLEVGIHTSSGYSQNFVLDRQASIGRTTDADTMAWWATIPETLAAIQATPESERISVLSLWERINDLLASDPEYRIWAWHPHFDIAILEHLFSQHMLAIPWKHNRVYDIFTPAKLLGFSSPKHAQAHRGLGDAMAECRLLCDHVLPYFAKVDLS